MLGILSAFVVAGMLYFASNVGSTEESSVNSVAAPTNIEYNIHDNYVE